MEGFANIDISGIMGDRVKHGETECVVVGCFQQDRDTFPNLITYDVRYGTFIVDYVTRFKMKI
jgi:hypothetical protein